MDRFKCCGEVVGVQYAYWNPEAWDGISEFMCLKCGKRIGRWSGKELKEGEYEKRLRGEQKESE